LIIDLGTTFERCLRRAHSLETVAERRITRKTLYQLSAAIRPLHWGLCACPQALLETDLAAIAADDVLGRKLQDLNLEPKSRARSEGRIRKPTRSSQSCV
jgi:hypothetical protein